MFRARILLTAMAATGLIAVSTSAASAGGCCGPFGFGCCNTSYSYAPAYSYAPSYSYVAQPQVYVAPPVVAPAPVVVQPVIQQAPVVQEVPIYTVNQGPVYTGTGPDYSPALYEPVAPISSYPYVSNYPRYTHKYWRYPRHGAPYRTAWRYPAYRKTWYGPRYPRVIKYKHPYMYK